MRSLWKPVATAIVLAVVWMPASTRACSVPVFRFALDRWAADPYTVYVVHRGPLPPDQEAIVARLEMPGTANMRVRLLDLARKLNVKEKAIAKQAGDALPRLVAEYADPRENDLPAWTGPLSDESIQKLLDSRVRQEIARRIIDGQSAVWLLLECGDAAKDDKAASLLKTQLETMPKRLTLPVPDDATAEEILSVRGRPAPRIEFSLIRLSRQNADEALVSMLLHTEEDLPGFDEPLAFPVFGRGRALEALVGKGITEENIKHSCAFLIGACSCEVKRINPGRDLLMAVDWEKSVGPGAESPKKERVKGKRAKEKEKAPASPAVSPMEELPPEEDLAPLEMPTSPLRITFYVLGGLAAVSLAVVLRVMR